MLYRHGVGALVDHVVDGRGELRGRRVAEALVAAGAEFGYEPRRRHTPWVVRVVTPGVAWGVA